MMTDAAEEKAIFCLGTGIAPSEYDLLTRIETNAFVVRQEKINKA